MKTLWKALIILNLVITGGLANTTIFSALLDNEITTSESDTDQICIEFKNNNGYKLDILLVGLTSTRLILMTKSFFVYDIPRSDMKESIGNLHLSRKPNHLSEKYPVLWNDQRFNKIKNKIYNGFMLHSDKVDKICLTVFTDKHDEYGVNYNINTNTVEVGWPYVPPETDIIQEQVLSTDEMNKFYAIRLKKNGLYICDYSYNPTDDSITPLNDSYPLCFKEDHTELYVDTGKTCPHDPVDWPPMTGFEINKQFILFDSHKIHQFSAKVWNARQEKVPSPITSYDYVNFFTCIGEVTATSLTWFYIIIIVIIILLIILFFILSMVIYVVVKKSRKRHKGKLKLFNLSIRSNNPTSGFIGILTRKPDSSVAPSRVVTEEKDKPKPKKKKHSKYGSRKHRTDSHF